MSHYNLAMQMSTSEVAWKSFLETTSPNTPVTIPGLAMSHSVEGPWKIVNPYIELHCEHDDGVRRFDPTSSEVGLPYSPARQHPLPAHKGSTLGRCRANAVTNRHLRGLPLARCRPQYCRNLDTILFANPNTIEGIEFPRYSIDHPYTPVG